MSYFIDIYTLFIYKQFELLRKKGFLRLSNCKQAIGMGFSKLLSN